MQHVENMGDADNVIKQLIPAVLTLIVFDYSTIEFIVANICCI
jgi:hypothetical protein